ncbi:hypothetical protein B0J11DRAFT_605132 [Dendryphion nanum]|uniref:DUF336-domain-containing protein n=1 Tax=Dendryphion nanum TaxID=256645 RepID=A0A9P9DWP9_9PLEO|nr:hypothetical protein B0J11DRAFT_605132 [Dendryphion nanum]
MRLPSLSLSLSPLLLALLPLTTCTSLNNTNNLGTSPTQRSTITLSQAQTILSSAYTNATALSIPQNIAVVSPSGFLIAFLHMDNAYLGSIELSQKKARTAVLFNGITSEQLGVQARPDGPLYGIQESNGGLVAFGGGLPIYLDGKLIGGVGVSGGTVEQDTLVAMAGIEGLGGVRV